MLENTSLRPLCTVWSMYVLNVSQGSESRKRLNGQKICLAIKSRLFSASSLHHRMLWNFRDGTVTGVWPTGEVGQSLLLRSSSFSGASAPPLLNDSPDEYETFSVPEAFPSPSAYCSQSVMSEIQELAPHFTDGCKGPIEGRQDPPPNPSQRPPHWTLPMPGMPSFLLAGGPGS